MSWVVIGAIGVATYLLRASFLVRLGGEHSGKFRRGLRFVPVAVITPLAVSAIAEHGSAAMELRVVAAAVAVLVTWRTRNAAAAMVAGMLVVWVVPWVSGSL